MVGRCWDVGSCCAKKGSGEDMEMKLVPIS